MCLLAVLWRMVPDASLIIAANREEAYDRPATPPQPVMTSIPFVAGIDERGGGTWLGVNRQGLLVGVTNAEKAFRPENARSRGLLVRDLLACPSVTAAVALATRELDSGRYDGCRLLLADAHHLTVVQGTDLVQVLPLPPGAHVLVDRAPVNAPSEARIMFTQAWIEQQECDSASAWLERLPNLLRCTGDAWRPAICRHGVERGTVSSTIIAIREPLGLSRWWHTSGPPDRSPFIDYSHLLAGW
jgi:hypothetical protein